MYSRRFWFSVRPVSSSSSVSLSDSDPESPSSSSSRSSAMVAVVPYWRGRLYWAKPPKELPLARLRALGS